MSETSTEIATRPARLQASLPAKIQYARALAESGLLPAAYRGNPGNVLYAVEYGDMLGLSPMAAITGVHIIEGKPGASAGLISALVRRAGHKLRVTGDARSATCQIIRCDDPDYVFEVTWTLKRNTDGNPSAEEAGLANKGTWKQYPASMLKSRAITQCARDACEEALFGLHYTPEELGAEVDADGNVIQGEIVNEPAGSQDAAWVDEALARAAAFAQDDDGLKLWEEARAKRDEGLITVADAGRIKVAIRDRRKELSEQQAQDDEPVDGVIVPDLDPDDPWALRIEEIAGPEDAIQVHSEVRAALEVGTLDEDKAPSVYAAIVAREAAISQQVAA